MDYYYDEYDFYVKSEFDEKVEQFKDELRGSVKKEWIDEIEHLKKSNIQLLDKKKELEVRLRELSNEVENDKKAMDVAQLFKENLNKDNIAAVIESMFDVTFDENTRECSMWWGLFVRFYNDRHTVLKLLRLVGVDVPNEADSIILPHEWGKEYLDKFLSRANRNYVCNGNYYADNLQYWGYRSAVNPFGGSCYDNIPWQFVLRNPLLNSVDYADKIAQCINSGSSGRCFCKIQDYQELNEDVLKLIVRNIKSEPEARWDSTVNSFLLDNVKLIESDEALTVLTDKAVRAWRGEKYIINFPEKYQIKFLESCRLDDFIRSVEVLKLDKSEKARIFLSLIGDK